MWKGKKKNWSVKQQAKFEKKKKRERERAREREANFFFFKLLQDCIYFVSVSKATFVSAIVGSDGNFCFFFFFFLQKSEVIAQTNTHNTVTHTHTTCKVISFHLLIEMYKVSIFRIFVPSGVFYLFL